MKKRSLTNRSSDYQEKSLDLLEAVSPDNSEPALEFMSSNNQAASVPALNSAVFERCLVS